MNFIILIILFSILINYIFFVYDESFLLNLYFLIFFLIIYIFFKNWFKSYNILKILKKYILFITLLKVNLNYNKLLGSSLIVFKRLFNKFFFKLKLYKYIFNFILIHLLNKYKSLINILFLFFFNNINNIKESLIIYIYILIDKLNLNDSLLFN